VAQYFRHLETHAFDPDCSGCAGGVKVFERIMRRARPASVGFSISVWAPIPDAERRVHTDPAWRVQWARCVEWSKARECFESLSGLEFISGPEAAWAMLSEADRLQRREVGLFIDCVSHYGHVDRFQLDVAHRRVV
jgi:hypothetical protein